MKECTCKRDGENVQVKEIAKVVPVFKSGDKTNPDNYRPISLLSSFSKSLEKVVSIRLTHFLEQEKILTKFQFGFRKSHSTAHAMVHFLNNIFNALNEKKHTVAIFCDLRKAFDTVNHDILLKKFLKWEFVELNFNGSEIT
jgi:retron-type reverse transcriptase